MKKKLYLNTIMSLLMQITTVICGFILPRLLLTNFGSEVNGLTQSISQFLGIISFAELGVGQVLKSALYRPLAQGDMVWVSKILKSGTRYFRKIAYGMLVYVAVLVVIFPYITDYRFEWMYTAVLICAISADAFARYYLGLVDRILLTADQRGYIQHITQIVTTLLNTLSAVMVIYAGGSIQLVKISSAAVFLLNSLFIRWYVQRTYKINRNVKYQEEPIAQKWNGIAQHISAVILEGTDNIVLTLFSSLANVSIYSVYFMVISGVRQFYVAATAGLQSMIGSLWAKGEAEKLQRMFSGIEVVLHFTVVFLFSCIAVLIVPFVQVYTKGLTDANYIQPVFAMILTLSYGVRCLRTAYNILILAAGHFKETQKCHVVAAILNIVISVPLVMRYGLVGVAVGTLIAFSYQTIWMAIYNSRSILKWNAEQIVKQFAVDAVTVGLILIATARFELQTLSYWNWLCMAIPVAMIALLITIAMAVLFYRRQLEDILRSWK